jgi:hypothetical protein
MAEMIAAQSLIAGNVLHFDDLDDDPARRASALRSFLYFFVSASLRIPNFSGTWKLSFIGACQAI